MENQGAAEGKAQELRESVKGELPRVVKQLELASSHLPTDQDFHFYSNFKQFKSPVKDVQNRVVLMLSQISGLKDFRTSSSSSSWPADSDEAYDWLVGVQDDLLERVDAFMDKSDIERKESKQKKPELPSFQASPSPAMTSPKDVKVARKGKNGTSIRSPVPFHVRNIPRPQDKFDIAADNSITPFRHPNRLDGNSRDQSVCCAADAGNDAEKAETEDLTGSTHPLKVELSQMAYVEPLTEFTEARTPKSLEQTPFTFVDTLHSLRGMSQKLRNASEIAVDLENHHYRSYQGFVCLMQVSTREEDFIVDTLAVRSHIGPCLGDIFSDPKIRKVMHGADRDIVWLQRDFGVYVCNLFDTGQAARVLQLPSAGLAFLLEHFCGVIADKRYQLADWRIRPLPAEMTKYAREDTHYLLYIHDLLKQQLHALRSLEEFDGEDPWVQVCRRSRDICLQLYTKEVFTETSFLQLHGLYEKQFRPDQISAVAKLYAWRDQMARKEDESTGYVLPNHLLFQIATEMPDNVRQLQMMAKWTQTYVGRNAAVIINLLREAKENPWLTPLLPRSRPGLKDTKVQQEAVEEQRTEVSVFVEEGARVIFTSEDADEMDGLQIETFKQEFLKVGVSKGDALANLVQTPGPVVVSRKAGSTLFGSPRLKSTAVSYPLSAALTPYVELGKSAAQVGTDPRTGTQPDAAGSFGSDLIPPAVVTAPVEGGKTGAHSEDEFISKQLSGSASTVGVQLLPDPKSEPEAKTANFKEVAGNETDSKSVKSGLYPGNTSASVDYAGPREELLDKTGGGSFYEVSTAFQPEDQTPTKDVPQVRLKGKTSGFGASLFGRSRQQSKGACLSATVPDQVHARLKAQAVESSIALPFRTTTTSANQVACSEVVVEKSKEIEAPQNIVVEANVSDHERSLERQDPTGVLGDILMFEDDEENDQIVESPTNRERHRKWWPPVGTESTSAGVSGGSVDSKGKKPNEESASGISVEERNTSFPPSLSEIHRTHRRRKRNRGGGPVVFGGVTGTPNAVERDGQRKKSKVDNPNAGKAIELDACASNGTFNYAEARKRLGLENLYVEKVGEQGRSERGKGKFKKNPSSNKYLGLGFDALRKVRVDPKPEGIPKAPRRQVYTMTGNRSATFKN